MSKEQNKKDASEILGLFQFQGLHKKSMIKANKSGSVVLVCSITGELYKKYNENSKEIDKSMKEQLEKDYEIECKFTNAKAIKNQDGEKMATVNLQVFKSSNNIDSLNNFKMGFLGYSAKELGITKDGHKSKEPSPASSRADTPLLDAGEGREKGGFFARLFCCCAPGSSRSR